MTAQFGPVETITVADLRVDDFIVSIPSQQGIAGLQVNSGVRDLRDDWGTWTRKSGGGRRRASFPIQSRIIMLKDPAKAAVNRPAECIVEVRRPKVTEDPYAVLSRLAELLDTMPAGPERDKIAAQAEAILNAS